MTLVAITQARSSGATTTALALARCWPRRAVVLEADPAGGDLAARYGVATSPGLVDLAASPGSHPATLRSVAQNLGGVDVVAAPVGPDVTRAALDALGPDPGWLHSAGDDMDVIVDCGRLPLPPAPPPPVLEAADVVVFIARPTAPAVVSLRQRLTLLPETIRARAVVIVIGDRPYPSEEVAAALGVPVVGVLAYDPVAVAAFGSSEPVRMGRSPLLRSAAVLAEALVSRCAAVPGGAPAMAGQPTPSPWPAVTAPARFSFSRNGTR